MLCEDNEETAKPADTDNASEINETSTPEKGRVWRWRNNNVGPRKNSDGPVLRATVKPVKRFIPELSSVASTPNPTPHGNPQPNNKQGPSASHDESTNKCDNEPKPKSKPNLPQTSQPCNKKKRVREQWSIEDKNHFFDAVSVHGKDFEAVQKAIAHKHKKRGDETVIKTKDQVRHLYYRTWTTINKLLDHETFPNQNVKGTQELFAVINYGELRKKLGGYLLKKKGILKLNELINCGSTSIRIKGKNYRIKTPSCKALKRIHDKKDAIKKSSILETRRIKLPLRVDLEVHPLSINAWNHVHLLAHNPRIKFNVPFDCRMSHLLIYLAKKWRPLSSKMFEVAEHGFIKNNSSMHKPTTPSTSSDMLEILVPPEATVKAVIQVHEVVTTKTHCVVSYAMHKTGKQSSSSRKKKKSLHNSDQIENIPATSAEICVSSEDEGALTDRLSDTDDHGPTSNSENCGVVSIEDVADATNHILQPDSSSLVSSATASNEITSVNDEIPLESISYNNSFQQVAEISAENVDEDSCPTAESANSNESTPSNTYDTDVIMNDFSHDNEETNSVNLLPPASEDSNAKTSNSTADNLVPFDLSNFNSSENVTNNDSDGSLNHDSSPRQQSVPSKTPTEPSRTVVASNEANISDTTSTTITSSPVYKSLSEISVETNLSLCENADIEKLEDHSNRTNDHCQRSENCSSVDFKTNSIKKYWNLENAGEITLAEIYLMLGKPGTFKLCYHWKRDIILDDSSVDKTSAEVPSAKLPTGVTALLQAATLLLSKVKKDTLDNISKEQNKNSSSKKDKMKINIGIQCNLSEKNSSSGTGSTAGASAPNKRAHGRGSSKFATPISSVDSLIPFAVPNIPPTRKRKMQSTMTGEEMLGTREMQQKVQVRLGDVQFRKQMEALNRRIDLFRPQNRNRSTRKPFIVQRSMMPNSGTTRKMMTFSIDSSRVNKVGFSPSGPTFPVRTSQNHATSNGDNNVSSGGSTSSRPHNEWETSGNAFGEALGLKISNQAQVETNTSQSSGVNVLAMAAKEAGLSLGSPMPDVAQEDHQKTVPENSQSVLDGCADLTEMLNTDSQPHQVPVSAEEMMTFETTQVDSNQTTSFATEPNLIRNDVALPIRPPTPSVDSLLESLELSQEPMMSKENTFLPQASLGGLVCMNDSSSTPLSMPVLDLPMTPEKPAASSPIHPWSINCNSRDGLGSFTTLNTPQRILPSDTEDSMDSSIYASKQPRSSTQLENDATCSLFNDTEVDLQMQCLMSENSVDFMAKFQELIRQNESDEKFGSSASVASANEHSEISGDKINDANRKGEG